MFSSRRLRASEIETLQEVFGAQVDYSKVRIHDNHWISNIAGIGAFVFGNNIQMSGKYAGDRKILIHKTSRVWQFQNDMKWRKRGVEQQAQWIMDNERLPSGEMTG